MVTTSITLLERLRRPDAPDAWDRFVELYTPLLFAWARQAGLQDADAADLVQDLFGVLVRQMPTTRARRLVIRRHPRQARLVRLRHERPERRRRDGRHSGRSLAAGVREGAGRRDAAGG